MEVSNGPRQPEAQRIKRYSTAARLPTLSLLTYPSARQKLSYRLDPICVLEVGWTLVLCGRDRYWCFHDTVQWAGECWGTSGGFGEFRICNYLLPALLEATWLNPATGASSLPLHRLTLKISCSRMVVKMGHLHNPHVTCSSYFVHAIFFPFKNIFLLCSYLKCHKRSMKKKWAIAGWLSGKFSHRLRQSHQLPECMRQNQRPLCTTVRARKYSGRLQCPRKRRERRDAVNVLSGLQVVLQGQQRVRAPVPSGMNPVGSSPTSGGSRCSPGTAVPHSCWGKQMKPEACLPRIIRRNMPNVHSRKTEN